MVKTNIDHTNEANIFKFFSISHVWCCNIAPEHFRLLLLSILSSSFYLFFFLTTFVRSMWTIIINIIIVNIIYLYKYYICTFITFTFTCDQCECKCKNLAPKQTNKLTLAKLPTIQTIGSMIYGMSIMAVVEYIISHK